MLKNLLLGFVFLLLNLPTFSHAQSAAITNGLSWLKSGQGVSGSWNNGQSSSTVFYTTATVLESFSVLGDASLSNTNGMSWLSNEKAENTTYLAPRIKLVATSGGDAATDTATLFSYKNSGTGWGGYLNQADNTFHTALALQALKAANYTDLATINSAMAYLTGSQNPDGGWGFTKGDDSSVYITAIVSTTLQQFPQMTSIAIAVNKATNYLLARQNADGGFGSTSTGSASTVYETSLAYIALVAYGQLQNLPLQNAVNYLTTSQSLNGSWNDDPYSTALALKALYLSENKPSPPPPPPAGGKITGTVIDKITNQRIGNVSVVLDSNQLINTTTDSSGNFTLSDIPTGSQKVNFTLTGYASTSATATVVVDTTASLGNVPMTSSYSTGTIAGTIADSSGKPLTGVAITVSGAWSGSATTGADGTYSFSYVTPGSVTISAAKADFQTVTSNGTVYARTTLTFSPRMSTTASQITTGTLVGRVVDNIWGVPIDHLPGEKGVTVTLSGGISAEPDPNNRGIFTIPNLAPGTYQAIVGMNGFASKAFRVVIMPGVTTDLGTIRLEMTVTKMTLTGKITDASTGAPIPGAEVTISNNTLTGRTDFAGTYAIADITHPSEFTLRASAAGYIGKSFTVHSSAWLETMNIALSPLVTKGSLTGKVVDITTGQPLAGVALTLASDPNITTATDASGTFTLNNVPQGPQQASLVLSGYASRTLTTAITAGTINNVGTIPLSLTPLSAAILGTVWDEIANTPFAGVTILATGTAPLQTVTATDGSYNLDNVTPGTVTVAATALARPGYGSARFSAALEAGGILVFNPALSTMVPGTVNLTLQTDKTVYRIGDIVGIAVNIRNREADAIAAMLHVQVIDSSGANAYETTVNLNLAADGTVDQPLSFILPASAQGGGYTVLAEVYNANGKMLERTTKGFGVAVSQIAVTPSLPATFAAGSNAISFNLANSGTLPVSAGVLAVTLKDPDGQIASTATQNFSLAPGENKTLTATLPIPALKFGTYTLTYLQSDETKPGQATDITLPNTVAVTALYDDGSHRIRGTANLTVTLLNTGRFNLDSSSASQPVSVTAAVPDAAYTETKTLSTPPKAGNATGNVLLYQFAIPETVAAGQHGTRITVTLPSGSAVSQTAQLAIMESSLSLSPIQTAYTAGDTIRPVIANSGGVDTPVQYRLSLYDAKAALIAEATNTAAVAAGSSLPLALAIPAGAVDGSYNLVVDFKDTKTGKEGMIPNAVTINGVKGTIQVQTDKQNYLLTENIAGSSSMTSSGTPLTGGNLHLQVTTGPGVQKTKTWTTQADFQTGVRSGVDTYGVNDWIIPDDDFDLPSLDSNKWGRWGNVSIQGGKVLVDNSTGVGSGFASTWSLEGDFDIQVDFSENKSFDNGVGISINAPSYYFSLNNTVGSGYGSSFVVRGISDMWIATGAADYSLTGRFRITRTADTVVGYGWSGNAWREVNRATNSRLSEPVQVYMDIYRGYPWLGPNSAKYDNFKVNSGRIKTENQTVDSVRLLPLNDNFDDGVLNEDRWVNNSVPPAVESLGFVHLQSNANTSSHDSFLVHKGTLVGDYAATTKYKNFYVAPTGVHSGSYRIISNAGTTQLHSMRHSDVLSRASGQFVAGMSAVDGYYLMEAEVPYSSDSGLLRVRRSAGIGYHDYWNGTGWATLHTRTGISTAPAFISLLTRSVDVLPTVKTDVDSFYTDKGTYTENGTITLKFDSGTSGTKWSKLIHSSTQPVGTSIKFRTRTSETEAGLVIAIWSDYLTASGSPVTSPAARWIQIETTLSTADTNVTPLLHDISVTYESNPGEILWQADVPANLAQGAVTDVSKTIGTLGMTGKFYLEGTLTSSTGQSVASAAYPFYVEQGNIQMTLAADKRIYRPGETVTISGDIKNLSSISAAGLTARIQGTGVSTPYTETFDLSANSAHPLSFTTTAGIDGLYQLTGSVTQNSALLADVADQYEVASPALAATLTVPDTAANLPFTVSVSLTNSGKVNATSSVHVADDSGTVIGDQSVSVAVGETRIVNFTRQITGTTTYTATVSGDLNQTLTKKVTYSVVATDSSVSGNIVIDKISYNPNEQATLTATVSAASMRENLSTLVTVTNSQGQAVHSLSASIPVLVQGQAVTNRDYWNTGANPAGTYLVTLQVLDPAGSAIAKATCNLMINSATKPTALLKGKISLDKQSILTGEPVTVSYSVANSGNVDLANIPLSIRTINLSEQTVYDTITDQATLVMGASYAKNGLIDTRNYTAKDYLVVLRATLGGVEETLAGTYFRVEGAPSAPAISSPANGADVDTFTPMLSVSNAADPNDDKLSYEFEIYSDSGLANLVSSGTVPEMTGTTTWTVPAPLPENQTCYWRARAYDGRLYGPWMSPATFRVNTVNDPPTAPTVSGPVEGSAVATLTPLLTVNNASDPDSTNLTYNFDLALDPGFTQIVATIKGVAGGQGTTSWTVPVSLQENGWYYWRAQADDWLIEGPWSGTARFIVNTVNDAPTAPVVAAPANGSTVAALATDIVVTNSTDPDSSSLLYYFEADTAPTFDSAGIIRSGSVTEGSATTLWHLSGLLDNTRYYLRAKASDGSADSPWSVVTGFFANTVNDPPTTPALANPSNGAGVSLFTPTLSVHNSTDLEKDILTYEFELYGDAALTNLVAQSGPIAEAPLVTGWTVPAALAENQTYYWRARASDGSLQSGWMPAASFMINTANDAPGAPQLSAPADGKSLATLTPTLTVVNAVDPDSSSLSYDFEVYNNGLLVDAITGVPGGAMGLTSVTLARALSDNTAYSWRARAFDGDRYGQWMNMATFTTHITQATIRAEIEFEPETLNKKSEGMWVKVEIELPRGYKASDIDMSSIRLEGTVPAVSHPTSIRCKEDGDELTVKFRRSDVINVLPAGVNVPVHVTGNVGSTAFEGVCIIRVIK